MRMASYATKAAWMTLTNQEAALLMQKFLQNRREERQAVRTRCRIAMRRQRKFLNDKGLAAIGLKVKGTWGWD